MKRLLDSGNSKPDIAEALGICVCSVNKELKRGTLYGTYDPEYAQKVMCNRHMLENNPELADRIAAMILDEHLSPNKIIERFKQEKLANGEYPLSNRTIYTAIDRGLIPNVTRDTLNAHTVTMCSKTLMLLLKKYYVNEVTVMIYDRLENITRYRGISEQIDKVIDFLEGGGLTDIPLGQHELYGEQITYNHFQYETEVADKLVYHFEAHQQHLDLHILLSGQEYIAVTPVETMQPIQTIECEDSIIYSGHIMTKVCMSPYWFVLLYPNEGHTGKLPVQNDKGYVDKVVFKLSIQD